LATTNLPESPGRKNYFLSILLFILGFVTIAGLIHILIPNPLRLHADRRSEKIELLDDWKGGVYSAAFGSSHVTTLFDPRAFDDELSAMQRRTPSINLGIEGGSQTEQRAMALEFLNHFSGAKPAERPCFILLELNAGANFTPDHLVHPRAINIYDWATMKFVAGLSDSGFDRARRVGRDGYALAAMAMHYSNVGMLSSNILRPPIDQKLLDEETADGQRGLHGLSGIDPLLVKAARRINSSSGPVAVKQTLTPGNYQLLEELAAATENRKLHLIYFVTPKYSNRQRFPDYPPTIQTPNGVEPILNLARPDLYPELFDLRYWYDDSHMNVAGAALGSRVLADQLKAWYSANNREMTCGG
jgi:hypothetical protein